MHIYAQICTAMHRYAHICQDPDSDPVVYVVPLSHILGRQPLVPAGDTGTIPYSMRDRKAACYEHGICDTDGKPGSGSCLFYINSWAMIWPTDYNVAPQ